ncbi:hypothetical protein Tco_1178174 [Tanacetum coccineum]
MMALGSTLELQLWWDDSVRFCETVAVVILSHSEGIRNDIANHWIVYLSFVPVLTSSLPIEVLSSLLLAEHDGNRDMTTVDKNDIILLIASIGSSPLLNTRTAIPESKAGNSVCCG